MWQYAIFQKIRNVYGIRKNVYLFKIRVGTIFIFHLQEPIVRIELWCYVYVCVCVCSVAYDCDFSRQEYWSELPFPSPGDLPYPVIEPASPALTGRFFTFVPPGKPCGY